MKRYIGLLLGLLLASCAAQRLDRQATAEDRAACQKDVAPYKGAAWLVAYRDCLTARGYK